MTKSETLMRARYNAFATADVEYLWRTSTERLRLTLTKKQLQESCEQCAFINLMVLDAKDQQPELAQSLNEVEFIATFIADGLLQQIHERSYFLVEDHELKYDHGELFETPVVKIERNQTCPCGSNKKFKKCHALK